MWYADKCVSGTLCIYVVITGFRAATAAATADAAEKAPEPAREDAGVAAAGPIGP